MDRKLTMFMILDGFGLNPSEYGNAIKAANTPNLDKIFAKYPHIQLQASGLAVGLPDGQMGNSEVGHLNIGAGRIVYQELTRITKAIEDGDFAQNEAINKAIAHAKNSTLHIFGLLSDGGVHSHIEHIKATIRHAADSGTQSIVLHAFMDGRDVPPTSGINYIKEMEELASEIPQLEIGMISGRFYAMDRDKRWERVERAYTTLTGGTVSELSASEAVEQAYATGQTDEFIEPVTCKSFRPVASGDSVIFCNFRPDRAREITRAFVDPDFDGFKREKLDDLVYVCMTQYDVTIPNVEIAFPPQTIKNTLGEYLAANGLSQLRIAETEKYAHVTFFFNGGVEAPNPLEDRILIPSPKVATYDLKPEMSAFEVTDAVVEQIRAEKYDVIILNFANADMVGHTGVFEAAVKAIEALDACVEQVVSAVLSVGGQLLLTADHGNADVMLDADGNVVTAHSTNPVPLAHIAAEPREFKVSEGKLADIAPTMLALMDLAQPPEMTGQSLI